MDRQKQHRIPAQHRAAFLPFVTQRVGESEHFAIVFIVQLASDRMKSHAVLCRRVGESEHFPMVLTVQLASDRMKAHAVLCRRVAQRPSHGAFALPLFTTTCFGCFLTRRGNIPIRLPADLDRIPDT